MYPISYNKLDDGTVIFVYDEKEYATWKDQGEKTGDVGMVLMRIVYTAKPRIIYNTFGTFENPCKQMSKFDLMHNDIFDGPLHEPEWYLKINAEPRVETYWKELTKSMRLLILDTESDTFKVHHQDGTITHHL